MAQWLQRIELISPRQSIEYGGKARNLALLARGGFPVPTAFALSTEAASEFFAAHLASHELPASLQQRAKTVHLEELASIAVRLRSGSIPPAVASALREVFRKMSKEGARTCAVRSSSNLEDQESLSGAGLCATVLGVRTEEQLMDAVRHCWASLFDMGVFRYIHHHKITSVPSMGLIIQAMVPADVSGVLFTANPLTGDTGEVMINAAYGLGCAIVDGRLTPDTYRVDKASGWVRDRVISSKTFREVLSRNGGVRSEPLVAGDGGRESLNDAMIEELLKLARRMDKHFGSPRDVEWAFSAGTLYVLQARPITRVALDGRARATNRSIKGPQEREEQASTIWTNANVGEALAGVATPLTWSVLRKFSEIGFRRALGLLGCSVPRDVELVGNFRGRIYLNLSELARSVAVFPGLGPQMLFELGGGHFVPDLARQVDQKSTMTFLQRLPKIAIRFLRENTTTKRRLQAFERQFNEEYIRLERIDYRVLPSTALDRTFSDIERLLEVTGCTMLDCYVNLLLAMVLFRSVLRMLLPEHAARLEKSLLSGLSEVESAAPGLELWRIANMACEESAVLHVLERELPERLRLEGLPAGPTRAALFQFVSQYGHRGIREAELSEPRWREDPTFLFTTLKLHLQSMNSLRSVDSSNGREVSQHWKVRLHEIAERRTESLRELDRRLPPPVRLLMNRVLFRVYDLMRLREKLRSDVTRVLSLIRAIALEVCRRVAVREPDAPADVAFFLTSRELHDFLRGDLGLVMALAERRRTQYEFERTLPEPPSTFVGSPPAITECMPHSGKRELVGLSASLGTAQGTARVLSHPSEASSFRPGEILVVPTADAGWTPLFLMAGAVVTDVGGPLSHIAVIAREYGVPAVVNVQTGTKTIRTGDQVSVDGSRGSVRLI